MLVGNAAAAADVLAWYSKGGPGGVGHSSSRGVGTLRAWDLQRLHSYDKLQQQKRAQSHFPPGHARPSPCPPTPPPVLKPLCHHGPSALPLNGAPGLNTTEQESNIMLSLQLQLQVSWQSCCVLAVCRFIPAATCTCPSSSPPPSPLPPPAQPSCRCLLLCLLLCRSCSPFFRAALL